MYINFLDLQEENGQLIHVLPVPYEATVSFATGTKQGPEALIKASCEIETWDPEYKQDLADWAHFRTAPPFTPPVSGPEDMYKQMLQYLRTNFVQHRDMLLALGGEHSIALPLVEFYKQYYSDLVVLQLDAHADLREEFQSSKYSHACVMSRVRQLGVPIVQVGIRSLMKEEHQLIETADGSELLTLFSAHLSDPETAAEKTRDFIGGRSLYITFDADGLDPSIMPGTGTPEPGGLSYTWLNRFWDRLLPGCRFVGMDFCELMPLVGGGVLSESVGVKCINRILLASLAG
ncbi:MAG: agmatinase [Thermodesulfobacteriota bacterium]